MYDPHLGFASERKKNSKDIILTNLKMNCMVNNITAGDNSSK